jgi:hypothetical protein
VVYIGAQVVLISECLLLFAALVLLILGVVKPVGLAVSCFPAQLLLWAVASWVGAMIRPFAGLLASTPSRAPPRVRLRQHGWDFRELSLLS